MLKIRIRERVLCPLEFCRPENYSKPVCGNVIREKAVITCGPAVVSPPSHSVFGEPSNFCVIYMNINTDILGRHNNRNKGVW